MSVVEAAAQEARVAYRGAVKHVTQVKRVCGSRDSLDSKSVYVVGVTLVKRVHGVGVLERVCSRRDSRQARGGS